MTWVTLSTQKVLRFGSFWDRETTVANQLPIYPIGQDRITAEGAAPTYAPADPTWIYWCLEIVQPQENLVANLTTYVSDMSEKGVTVFGRVPSLQPYRFGVSDSLGFLLLGKPRPVEVVPGPKPAEARCPKFLPRLPREGGLDGLYEASYEEYYEVATNGGDFVIEAYRELVSPSGDRTDDVAWMSQEGDQLKADATWAKEFGLGASLFGRGSRWAFRYFIKEAVVFVPPAESDVFTQMREDRSRYQ